MTDRVFCKQVADRCLPDLQTVRQAVLQGAVSPSPRRKLGRRLLPVMACAVILAVGLMALPRQTTEHPTQGDLQPGGVMQPTIPPEVEAPEPSQPAVTQPEDVIHFTEAETETLNAIPTEDSAFFTAARTEYLDAAQATAYLGWDPRPTVLPDGVIANPDEGYLLRYDKADVLLLDQFSFSYDEDFESEQYRPTDKKMTVSTAKANALFDYCIYVWPENMLDSTIAGVSMKLGHRSVGYGPYTVVENGPNTPAGYYHLFIAEFTYQGVQVQVLTHNFTQDEFLAALRSMVDKPQSTQP